MTKETKIWFIDRFKQAGSYLITPTHTFRTIYIQPTGPGPASPEKHQTYSLYENAYTWTLFDVFFLSTISGSIPFQRMYLFINRLNGSPVINDEHGTIHFYL